MKRLEDKKITAKEYLGQVRQLSDRIKMLQEEIRNLKELSVSIGAIQQGEKVMSSTSGDKMADTICLIDEKIEEYEGLVKKFTMTRAKVFKDIGKIDNVVYQQILYQKYCALKKWEQIATDMGYGYRWLLRLHGRALEEFRQVTGLK